MKTIQEQIQELKDMKVEALNRRQVNPLLTEFEYTRTAYTIGELDIRLTILEGINTSDT